MKPSDLPVRVILTHLKGLCTLAFFLQSKLSISSRMTIQTSSIGSILDVIMRSVEHFITRFLSESSNPDLKRQCQAVVAVFTDYLMEALSSENANIMLGRSKE